MYDAQVSIRTQGQQRTVFFAEEERKLPAA
jgi:hypothetical protein